MGTALLGLADLFTPFQSLADRWLPGSRARRRSDAGLRYVGIRPSCTVASTSTARGDLHPRTLRVVRTVDLSDSGRSAFATRPLARVRISGRMADVCAELDRLAEQEAACSSPRPSSSH
ncbi:MAG: hypothetical protein KKC85_09250 [Gammaproteobacteria bacterium]|nr:hypothetical protein [Gammaproteobacteria bacterium]MBU1442924.1 hypothetical protein [Gammaproteobacteria bacterium]MBU2286608.1 hypothetical protein [Gammaproteobacteria bacterium]